MPIDRIIVAYDASPQSREAFAYAIEIARKVGCEITVLRAIEPPPAAIMPDPAIGFATGMVPPMDPGPFLERERESAARELPEAVAFGRRAGIACEPLLIEDTLVEALEELARPGDLIALGAKGRFADARVGSSTSALVQRAPCPVLVAGGQMRDLARVLCVFDDAERSRDALEWARDLSRGTGWPLTVLAVTRLGDRLESVLQHAQDAAPEAMVVHFGPEDVPEARQIETAAAHSTASLVVMGAFTDGWFHRLIFGGTTDHVLRHINAPLVLVGKRAR